MSPLHEQIARFRNMATADPDNELAHYRLGMLLAEDGQLDDAVASYRRTLEISPQFSKVFQLLGKCLIDAGRRDEAVETLKRGYLVADERGDNMPRDEMARMLVALGEPAPVSPRAATPAGKGDGAAGGTGFKCRRMMCMAGGGAVQLDKPPMNDEVGRLIHERVCADCWTDWLKVQSIKVINELRLDLSTERGVEEYDRYMREFLSLDE